MRLMWIKVAVLLMAMAAAAPVFGSEYVALRFPPAKQPAVYLQVDDDALRMADSARGLEAAEGVAARQNQTEGLPQGSVSVSFPEFTPSCQVRGFDSVAVSVQLYRAALRATQRQRSRKVVSIPIRVRFAKRDAQGVVWSYTIGAWAGDDGTPDGNKVSTEATAPTVVDVRPPLGLQLKVETKLLEQERKVGIGVRLLQDGNQIAIASKGESPAPVRLEVLDRAGQLVDAQDGDLGKLGFG